MSDKFQIEDFRFQIECCLLPPIGNNKRNRHINLQSEIFNLKSPSASLPSQIGLVKKALIGSCISPLSSLTCALMGSNRSKEFLFVMVGGIVAGTFDITYACVYWGIKAGVQPPRIFQSVARGVLGAASFRGGAATAALGLFLHYFIAIAMSFAYYLVASRWKALHERAITLGAAYGLVLYGVMTYIVVPLSRAGGGGGGDRLWIALSIVVHMFLIGVPIALFTKLALNLTLGAQASPPAALAKTDF
jgi:hypothetical protein